MKKEHMVVLSSEDCRDLGDLGRPKKINQSLLSWKEGIHTVQPEIGTARMITDTFVQNRITVSRLYLTEQFVKRERGRPVTEKCLLSRTTGANEKWPRSGFRAVLLIPLIWALFLGRSHSI